MTDRTEPIDTTGYRVPPEPIPRILSAPPIPALLLSPDRRRLALFRRDNLVPLAELAEPEVGLAGVRINPATAGPSRQTYYYGISILPVEPGAEERPVDVPEGSRISSPRWSPDSRRLAFLITAPAGIELWVADTDAGNAERVLGPGLNDTLGPAYHWLPDGGGLVAKRIPPGWGDPPAAPAVPPAPVVQENRGAAAPARTYQDLLASPHDEALFEHHFAAEVVRVNLSGGAPELVLEPAIYSEFTPAPGGELLLVERITRPYSYLVPWYRFPTEVEIRDLRGGLVRRVAQLPLAETVPIAFDAVPPGPRSFQWRSDAPAALMWVEALDGGDPRVEAGDRDRVWMWESPFEAPARTLITLDQRYAGVVWGTDEAALVYSRWWNRRWLRTHRVRPGDPDSSPALLFDRSFEDRYGDPGSPVTTRNAAGQPVLLLAPDGRSAYLSGEGASPEGNHPFLDRLDLESGETERIWQCQDPYYEAVAAVLDAAAHRVLTRRESRTDPPNDVLRDLREGEIHPLTAFPDPAPELAGIGRELMRYARSDGVKLSATLYTPPGYDPARDGRLPTLLWAYPREYLDPDAAGQIDDSPNRFSRPAGASPLFLLTQGYAVLEGPAMPIVARDGAEPNDGYVEQLVMGAEAAVAAVVDRGVADPGRIAIGGHSYGAAMTANLLAHTELFRAGIARSGAYNRTLTPFGFQHEQRTYWEAPAVYHRMSPFSYAHLVKRPLLLVHGASDDNTGTYPMQSERFYHALKGHGATVRYVSLPLESHGYRARESILHVLAEMIEWLAEWVG